MLQGRASAGSGFHPTLVLLTRAQLYSDMLLMKTPEANLSPPKIAKVNSQTVTLN